MYWRHAVGYCLMPIDLLDNSFIKLTNRSLSLSTPNFLNFEVNTVNISSFNSFAICSGLGYSIRSVVMALAFVRWKWFSSSGNITFICPLNMCLYLLI